MNVNNNASFVNFNPGNHLCCVYKTDNEMFSFIIPFFIDGLQKGNKCLFILGDESSTDVIKIFNDFGFDLSFHILKKNFVFTTHKDIYFKNDIFDVTVITSTLKEAESEALKQGYSALRIAGSTTSWAIEETPIIEKLLKYEDVVNEFIESSYIIAACLYKEDKFKSKTLTNVLLQHPLIYLFDKLADNKYYTYPSRKNNEGLPEITYEEMIKSLV